MPIQSPAKDLRKTSTGALFGRGREMGSAQPSERPSQGLCSDRGAKRSQNSPPKDLEKPFKGRCAVADPVSRYSGASGQKNKGSTRYADAPLVRETDTCTRPEGARGSVRAMPEHSTCRDGLVATDEHSHPAVREMGTHRLRASVPTCVGTPPVTDEHRTNCNTRSPRRFRSCCNRGLPYGNQSEPSECYRWDLFDSHSPCQLWPVLRRGPRQR